MPLQQASGLFGGGAITELELVVPLLLPRTTLQHVSWFHKYLSNSRVSKCAPDYETGRSTALAVSIQVWRNSARLGTGLSGVDGARSIEHSSVSPSSSYSAVDLSASGPLTGPHDLHDETQAPQHHLEAPR